MYKVIRFPFADVCWGNVYSTNLRNIKNVEHKESTVDLYVDMPNLNDFIPLTQMTNRNTCWHSKSEEKCSMGKVGRALRNIVAHAGGIKKCIVGSKRWWRFWQRRRLVTSRARVYLRAEGKSELSSSSVISVRLVRKLFQVMDRFLSLSILCWLGPA